MQYLNISKYFITELGFIQLMIIYHQLTMKLYKNVRNYLSGKVLTVHYSNVFKA